MPDSSQSNELLPSDPGWDYGDVLPLARNKATGQLSLAIPSALRGAVNDLALALTVPGQVASGQLPLAQAAPLVPRMALGLAGMGGMGEAPEGALRIFAGRTAKTADTAALSRAMSMESQGHAPGVIWDSTGWMKGPDGNWRFEIPDAGASIKSSSIFSGPAVNFGDPKASIHSEGDRLGDVLDHPELFKAYPSYKDLPVRQPSSAGYAGAYLPAIHTMELSTMSPEDFLSTALHETQHAVQSREGFASGGSPEDFLTPQFYNDHFMAKNQLANARISAIRSGVPADVAQRISTKQLVGMPLNAEEEQHLVKLPPDVLDKMQSSLQTLAKLGEQRAAATESYRNLAGEVEARNVQERHASGETAYPPSTPGYTPFEQQIVHFDPSTGSLSFKGFHGTPHTFEPVEGNPFGAFRDEAVGSGEGAQAYGWGHYVAGNKAVAEEYRNKLSRGMYPSQDVLQQYFKPGDIVNGYGGKDKVISFNPGEQGRWSVTVQAVDKNGTPLQGIDGRPRTHTTVPRPEDIEKKLGPQQLGNLYHVEIRPDEHELLDWDNPVSDNFLQKLEPVLGEDTKPSDISRGAGNYDAASSEKEIRGWKDITGEDVYRYLSHKAGGSRPHPQYGSVGNDERASALLHEAGIPGIKYLDQGSRDYPTRFSVNGYKPDLSLQHPYKYVGHLTQKAAADLAKQYEQEGLKTQVIERNMPTPTSNYVIFHPSNLKIVGRNGVEWQPEPLDHNPFTHKAEPVDYNPFVRKP